ncbi:MAG: ATP-dependent DNA ligase [Thermoleophilia bacterium]|nr:ATP-dependent DNA ligase [Thermoleophilia bacterium]
MTSSPLPRPLAPQLARKADAAPTGASWAYEPKLDGFRAIAFVDGETAVIQSRGGKDLTRYFPEVTFPAGRYVLDGELLIDAESGAAQSEDFGALSQRIHPAASRIARLAAETPARFAAFDLLAEGGEPLLERPFRARRAALERLAGGWDGGHPVSVLDQTLDPAAAAAWLTGSSEGLVAKDLDAPYLPGERRGTVKVKRRRTADCVVAGYREGKAAGTVGSLMLGLYDADGHLRLVGHTSGLSAAEKRRLVTKLAPLATGVTGASDTRWRAGEERAWVTLRPEAVVEITYDQVSDGRIRHGSRLVRWRDDKAPRECTTDQLDD